jgi:hypothetical protein
MGKKLLQWHFVRSCDRLNATFFKSRRLLGFEPKRENVIFLLLIRLKTFTAMLCNGQLELKNFITRALWGFS